MWVLLLKFVVAGSLVVAVDFCAARSRPDIAGLIAVMPALTLVSYSLVSIQGGAALLHRVAGASLTALPAVAAYILTVFLGAKIGWPPWVLLPLGVGIYFVLGTLLLGMR